MLKGITTLFSFLLLGEVLNRFLLIPLPSPILGMLLLLLYLLKEKKYSKELDSTVDFFLKYLPIFILPSAAGLITQINLISYELLSVIITLVFSTTLSMIISSKVMDYFIKKSDIN